MPYLLPDQVDDFVNLTISKFKRGDWVDISMEHPEYIAAAIINRKKVSESGAADIRWKVQVRNNGTARPAGLYDKDQTNVEDLSIEALVNWRMSTVNWSYDIYESIFQSDPETIVSILQMREHSAFNDYAELQETQLWSAPDSDENTEDPYGIPFWIQKDTTTEGDFLGGNPSGFSNGAAGINTDRYPKWKNYAGGYSKVTPLDLVRKVKKALQYTHFQPAHPHPELGFSKAEYHIYTVYSVKDELERLAESRNDNHGNDVAKFMNSVVIAGTPITMCFYLTQNDPSNPLYGVNWGKFRPFVKKGANMRQTKKNSAHQRNVREVHYDTAMNYICYDRRRQWVLSQA